MFLQRRHAVLVALALLAFILFSGSLRNDFTNWDDPGYVTKNPLIEQLDPGGIREMFQTSSVFVGNWAPLNILSYAVDYALWGRRPLGYHLTNVLLHPLCTVLLYLLLCRILGRGDPDRARVPAALAAALFAIHPVQVESVAWVAERKNLLGMALFLGAFLAWLRATRAPLRAGASLAFLLLFTGALLAKVHAVILPPLLVLYEWIERPVTREQAVSVKSRAMLLVPAFAIAVCVGWINVKAQDVTRVPRITGDLLGAIATAPVLVLGYVKDLLLPMNRSAALARTIYEAPWHAVPLIAWILIIAWTVATIARKRSHPNVSFFSLWFLGALLPILNLVPITELAADRYQYWAAPGLFALAGSGTVALWHRLTHTRRPWAIGAALGIGVLLCTLTTARVPVWKDSLTLWTDAVGKNPSDWNARFNLAQAYEELGKMEEMEREYREAARLAPPWLKDHGRLGFTLMKVGKMEEAERELREGTREDPEDANTRNNLSLVLTILGKTEEAEREAREAARLAPGDPLVQGNLGWLLLRAGKEAEAERALREAAQLDPGNPQRRYYHSVVLLQLGNLEEAEREARETVRLAPQGPYAHSQLGEILLRRGKLEEAEREAREAVRLAPQNAAAGGLLDRVLGTLSEMKTKEESLNVP